MQTIATTGLDIAKSVFQVHGVDAAGQVVVRRQLKRRQVLAFFAKLAPCLIGIEVRRDRERYPESHIIHRAAHLDFSARQKNLWVTCGSGNLPST
jgi:hypothetical protein